MRRAEYESMLLPEDIYTQGVFGLLGVRLFLNVPQLMD
jgi:hypothetical protein